MPPSAQPANDVVAPYYPPPPNPCTGPTWYDTPAPGHDANRYAMQPTPPQSGLDAGNPLGRPLAAGILGAYTAGRLADERHGAAVDLATMLLAAGFVGNSPNATNLAGGGVAVGGSFIPTLEDRVAVVCPCTDLAFPAHWWVQSRKKVGFAASLAVGGGVAVLGGGAFVGVSAENESVFCTLMPQEEASKLVLPAEKGSLRQMMSRMQGNPSPVTWPDFARPETLKVNDCLAINRFRKGALGFVLSTMMQNVAAYASITGMFERVIWLRSRNILQIRESVQRIDEIGLVTGMSMLQKFDASINHNNATAVVMEFDISTPTGYQAAVNAILGDLPKSDTPLTDAGYSVEQQFGHGLPGGVTLVSVEFVKQRNTHMGFALLDPIAKNIGLGSGGFARDGMRDHRVGHVAAGSITSDTAARRHQVGMFTAGTSGELIYVNALSAKLRGESQQRFMPLTVGLQLELSKVSSSNRQAMVDSLNKNFELNLANFPKIESKKGYFVCAEFSIDAEELAALAQVTPAYLAQHEQDLQEFHEDLMKLIGALVKAGQDAVNVQPTVAQIGGFQPATLAWHVENDAMQAPNAEPLSQGTLIAQSQAMLNEVSNAKMMGALYRLLDDNGDKALSVGVRNAAIEVALERVGKFALTYSDEKRHVRATDSETDVIRRLKQGNDLRATLDKAFEALQADVIAQAFQPEQLAEKAQQLLGALIDVENILDWECLTDRQKLCLWRDEDIYHLLPPAEKARALALFARNGSPKVRLDEKQKVERQIHDALLRVESLHVPEAQRIIIDGRLQDLREALNELTPVVPNEAPRSYGPVHDLDAPENLLAMAAAQAPGDRLSALHLYDVHFIVQDTEAMAGAQAAVREALREGVKLVSNYDRDGIEVTFLNECLAAGPWQNNGSRYVFAEADVQSLQWQSAGKRAMVGNVLEALVGDYVRSLQQGQWRKPKAFIVITADGMADRNVFADTLKMAKRSFNGSISQVCVGLLPIQADVAGNAIASWLDGHKDIKDMVEADLNTQHPVAQRLEPLLHGMLDKRVDDQNNFRNTGKALKTGMKRLMGMKLE